MKSDKPPSGKDLADVPLMQVTHDHLLNEAVKVTQPVDGYRVGSDAVLLAASIGTMTGRVLDLGAGVGGVCLCLAQRLVELQVTAVEKNADMAALCNENATQNGLQNRIRVLTADIREMPPVLAGSFDHVVSNPPYHNSHGTRPRRTAAQRPPRCGRSGGRPPPLARFFSPSDLVEAGVCVWPRRWSVSPRERASRAC